MGMEDIGENSEGIAELWNKMEELTDPEQSLGRLLEQFNKLPPGEERCKLFAHIGADLVERGGDDDIKKAVEIARKLEEQADFIEYAAGLVELIGLEKYYDE